MCRFSAINARTPFWILRFILLLSFTGTASESRAQHDMQGMDMGNDTMKMDEMPMEMHSLFSQNLPMSRDGSGTSWQPR